MSVCKYTNIYVCNKYKSKNNRQLTRVWETEKGLREGSWEWLEEGKGEEK